MDILCWQGQRWGLQRGRREVCSPPPLPCSPLRGGRSGDSEGVPFIIPREGRGKGLREHRSLAHRPASSRRVTRRRATTWRRPVRPAASRGAWESPRRAPAPTAAITTGPRHFVPSPPALPASLPRAVVKPGCDDARLPPQQPPEGKGAVRPPHSLSPIPYTAVA